MKKFTVSLAVVAMAFVFVGGAMAADWNFYGSARVGTWYFSRSSEVGTIVAPSTSSSGKVGALSNSTGAPKAPGGADRNSDLDLRHTLQPNARVGATVSSGNVSGRFEYGTGVNVRILRGTWNFGSGELLVGQTYTPISWTWYSSQAVDFSGGDEGLLGLGLVYGSRKPMLQLKFGGFKIALVEPNVVSAANARQSISLNSVTGATGVGNNSSSVNTTGGTTVYADTDVILPKIEASYRMSQDKFFFDVGAGYQAYDYTDSSDQNSKTLTSYVLAAGGGYNFGKGYVKLQLNYDMNGAAYGLTRNAAALPSAGKTSLGLTGTVAPFTSLIDPAKNDFADVTRFGGALVLGGQINDLVGVEFGGALQQFSNDLQNSDIENTTYTLYLQFPFTVADGVILTPELGYMDWGDLEIKGTGAQKWDAGTNTYFGLYSKINF